MNVYLIHQENCTVPISHLWCVLCILRLCISHLSPPLPVDYRIKNILELHKQSQCLTFSSSEFSFCGILSILTSYPLLLFVKSDSWAPFFGVVSKSILHHIILSLPLHTHLSSSIILRFILSDPCKHFICFLSLYFLPFPECFYTLFFPDYFIPFILSNIVWSLLNLAYYT